jgi:Predicted membrane protein involved in D-alanine export
MLLGGLWHGAALTFLFWGLLHGLYLVIFNILDKFFNYSRNKYIKNIQRVLLIFLVFVLTTIAWIFFRSNTLMDSFYIIKTIFLWESKGNMLNLVNPLMIKCLLVLLFVLIVDFCRESSFIYNIYLKSNKLRVLGVLMSFWVITLLGNFSGNEFVYFQF